MNTYEINLTTYVDFSGTPMQTVTIEADDYVRSMGLVFFTKDGQRVYEVAEHYVIAIKTLD